MDNNDIRSMEFNLSRDRVNRILDRMRAQVKYGVMTKAGKHAVEAGIRLICEMNIEIDALNEVREELKMKLEDVNKARTILKADLDRAIRDREAKQRQLEQAICERNELQFQLDRAMDRQIEPQDPPEPAEAYMMTLDEIRACKGPKIVWVQYRTTGGVVPDLLLDVGVDELPSGRKEELVRFVNGSDPVSHVGDWIRLWSAEPTEEQRGTPWPEVDLNGSEGSGEDHRTEGE